MCEVIDITRQKLPPHRVIGRGVVARRRYTLAMALPDGEQLAVPLVIDEVRQVAWLGSWDFIIDSAARAIDKAVPLH